MKLTRKQKQVLDDLLSNKGIQTVIKKHKISAGLLARWTNEERWQQELRNRIEHQQKLGEIKKSLFVPTITSELLDITKCENKATARLACKDILEMEQKKAETGAQFRSNYSFDPKLPWAAGDPDEKVFRPEVARRLLEVLAEMRDKYGEIFTTRREYMMEREKKAQGHKAQGHRI